jgi:serine/threonine-protein kinase
MRVQDWPRVSDLFERALLLDAAERGAWLDAECAGDAALRASVQRLLDADERAADFLEKPLPGELVDAADDARTRRFGAYRASRLIGSGGMGEVWLAVRSDGEFEQQVAIKRLLCPTADLRRRFLQERRLLARLTHPHVAQLFDGGVDDNGSPYFVMEYVDGAPITLYCETQKTDLDGRLRLFLQVCAAVQYAHRNLVVHRDLKPTNVLVNGDGMAKLLDFGIAKLLDSSEDEAATQTLVQRMTPDYAAPEQIRGEAVTTATDVYALGVLLFELVAGVRPYRRGNRRADVERALEAAPAASASVVAARSDAAPRDWARRLRGDLDRILAKAMAHEPERRYATAEAFADDLERYLDGRPILARGYDSGYRMRKFLRRNRVAVVAAGLITVSLIAGAAVALWQAREAMKQAAFAAEQQALARERATAAERTKQFMIGLFEASDPAVAQGVMPRADELLARGSARVAEELRDQPKIQAELYQAMAVSYMGLNRFDDADHLLDQASRALAPLTTTDVAPLRAGVELARGSSSAELGHYKVALAALDRADAAWRYVAHPPANELARIQTNRAWVYRDLGRLQESETELRHALTLAMPAGAPMNDAAALTLNNLAFTLELLGRERDCIDAYERLLAWRTQNDTPENPARLWAVYTFARSLRAFAQPARARDLLEGIRPTMLKVLGPDHSDLAGVDIVRGQTQMDLGDLQGGRAVVADAVARSHRVTRRNSLWASAEFALGEAEYRSAHLHEAQAHFRTARAVWVDLVGEDLPDVRNCDSYLAAMADADPPDALAQFQAIATVQRARSEYGLRLTLSLLAEKLRRAPASAPMLASVERELAELTQQQTP